MGVHILYDNREIRGKAALMCSTTDVAFGPVFLEDDDHSAEERVEAFLRWLPGDPRLLTDEDLMRKYHEWLTQEPAQYAAEAKADAERWDDR